MASLEFDNITSSSFEVRVTGMSTSVGTKTILWELFSPALDIWVDLEDWTSYDIAEDETDSDWLYVEDLDPDYEYEIRANVYYSDGWDDRITGSCSTLPEDSGGDDDDIHSPTTNETGLGYSVSNGSAEVTIESLNPDYSGTTWVQWTVSCLDTGEEILSIEKNSEDDSDYYYISFDVIYGYQYHVYVEVSGEYIDVDTWGDSAYITAEDTGDPTWTVYRVGDLSISDVYHTDLSLGMGHVNLISVTFRADGTATFYSEGTDSNDVIAYLSLNERFDTLNGVPIEIEVSDDDSNGDRQFKFTYDVTAGTEYFIWVRCWSADATAVTTIYIEPPISDVERPEEFEWVYPKNKEETFKLPYDEWCLLLDHINEVRVYKGLQPMESGSTVGFFYYPTKNGETFTAVMYNQALKGITEMMEDSDYTDNAVQPGWPVTADCLNLLMNMINSIE